MRFWEMSAREISSGVREKKFSAAEVFEDCLRRAEDCEGRLSALMTVTAETGRAQARRIDEMVAKGESPGLLAGVPVVIKDNICTHGVQTTAGSRILDGWTPPYDATVWALLAAEGAVLLGKGSMDEFGTGIIGKSAFGQTANPWDTSRVPGGSSGGSAAAVAAGYAPFSLGTDTGGSIRLPASFCGIYGLKPTYGLVSRYGLVSYGSSFDQIGPFTRDVEDMALVMSVLARHDPKDSTSVHKNDIFCRGSAKRTNTLKGRRVALVKEFMNLPLDQPVADAMKRTIRFFEESGAEVVEISLPMVARYAVPYYYTIEASEVYTNLARFDGIRYGHAADGAGFLSTRDMFEAVRSEGFSGDAKSKIILGTYITEQGRYEEYHVAATRVRSLIAAEYHRIFGSSDAGANKKIDCILQPISPYLPCKIGETYETFETAKGYALDLCILSANVAGLPGFSFRAGFSDSVPVGLQIVGPRWSDEELLDIGFELEKLGENLSAPKIAEFPGER